MIIIDRLIFALALIGFCGLSIVDGARNPIIHLLFVSFFLGLLSLWLLLCSKLLHNHRVHIEFRWVWIAWIAWLGLSWLQARGNIGLYSADPYLTWLKLYLYAGYCGGLMLFTVLLRTRPRITLLIWVITAIGLLQIVFGLMNYYGKYAMFGWVPTHYAFSRVTGTFINRNFFANLIAMSSSFAVIWMLVQPGPGLFRSSRSLETEATTLPGHKLLGALVILLFLAGLMLSGSRAALISVLFGLLVVGVLIFFDSRIRSYYRGLIIVLPVVVLIFGAKLLRLRISTIWHETGERLQQWKLTLEMIWEAGLFGQGPGTYETVFRGRQSEGLSPLIYNHAHNDYLELLIEQGLVGMIFPGIIISVIVYFALRRLFASRDIFRKRMILSCLFGVSVIFAHGMMDFPYQIPANVWLYVMFLAILMNASMISLRQKI